jgi:hypothetical protein
MDQTPKEPDSVLLGRTAKRVEYLWAFLVLAAAGWAYFWTATSGATPLTSKLLPDDMYNRLSDAFLAGQLSFLEAPNPKLAELEDPYDPAQNAGLSAFHDVSYYDGKYYLYFGAAPAVLLLAPWKLLTGSYLGENVAAAIFAWLGVGASMALVLVIRRRHFPGLRGWIGGLCLVSVAFCNFALPMLRRPVFYELAIASAYAFAMAALLCLALAIERGPRRRLWLFLAGLSYGLTLASRPNYLFGVVALAAPFITTWKLWRAKAAIDWKPVIRDAVALVAPLATVIALILVYNALRFGNPLEFGTYYMLAGMHPQRDALVSVNFIPTNIWFYLLAPAQLSAFFPFVQVIHMPWFTLPTGYSGEEDMFGILPNMPFFLAAFLLVPSWNDGRVAKAAELRDFATGALALVALNALVLFRLNGASNRYFVDLLPALLALACVGVFWAEQVSGPRLRRFGVRAVWIAALVSTAGFNVIVSILHNELFRISNPSLYGRMAHVFNHVSLWLGETTPAKVGPIHLRLRFPTDRFGQLEPLVVTGLSFRADFIYLYYTDPYSVQIGFEHTSYGGDLTKPPIDINYGAEHTVEIEMGSLYPPIAHPYFDGMSPRDIEQLKRTLRVTLDGNVVLSGTYDFYDSSPGDVVIGRNSVSDAFGRRFTGEILENSRLPARTAP